MSPYQLCVLEPPQWLVQPESRRDAPRLPSEHWALSLLLLYHLLWPPRPRVEQKYETRWTTQAREPLSLHLASWCCCCCWAAWRVRWT